MTATAAFAQSGPRALVYVSDTAAGIRRLRRGNGFAYRAPDGRPLRDADELARIRALAIPPAYTQVWICPRANGHLQATGRDARGRKQYRYHPEWQRARGGSKFERLRAFGAMLPRIRAAVRRDLAAPLGDEVRRAAVLATVVHLLDTTLERVGNDEYARSNGSYGLTTLRCRHASVRSGELRLRFRGKSGVVREVSLHDRRIARIVRRCQALPGQELFQYLDTQGSAHRIDSADINDYLRAVAGDFTAKDFRTWHGSVRALQCWRELDPEEAAKPTPAHAKRVLAQVAERLGNTVAVCRKAYVHPRVLTLLTDAESAHRVLSISAAPPKRRNGWSAAEVDFLRLLGRCG